MRARGQDGLRCRLVRRAPLPDELLDVPLPGGDLRRADPADQAHPPRIRRGDSSLPPSRARGRARGDGRSPVGGPGRVRHRPVGGVRADRHGHRPAPHARDVGRVAGDDSEDLGGRPLLVGGPVLERAAARRAPEALSEAAPADVGGGAAARHVSARGGEGHRGDGAERGRAVLPRAAHQGVQGAGAPRDPGGQGRQRPVAVLDDGPLRRRRQGGARAGGEIAPDLLRAGSPVPEGPDAPVRAARRFVGRCARASQGELRALSQDGRHRTARPRWICPAAPGRSRPRCGTRSTPTPSSTAACSWRAIPRPAFGPSPFTRPRASTSCSSSWRPRRCPTTR